MNGVSLTILHLLPRFKRYFNYLLGYTRSNVQTLQMRIKDTEVEDIQRHVSAKLWIYRILVEYAWRGRRINRTNMTQNCEDWCTNDFLYLVQTPVVVYLSPSTRICGQQPQIGYSFRIHSLLVSSYNSGQHRFIYLFIYLLAIRKINL
jgi:hypothetical protein